MSEVSDRRRSRSRNALKLRQMSPFRSSMAPAGQHRRRRSSESPAHRWRSSSNSSGRGPRAPAPGQRRLVPAPTPHRRRAQRPRGSGGPDGAGSVAVRVPIRIGLGRRREIMDHAMHFRRRRILTRVRELACRHARLDPEPCASKIDARCRAAPARSAGHRRRRRHAARDALAPGSASPPIRRSPPPDPRVLRPRSDAVGARQGRIRARARSSGSESTCAPRGASACPRCAPPAPRPPPRNTKRSKASLPPKRHQDPWLRGSAAQNPSESALSQTEAMKVNGPAHTQFGRLSRRTRAPGAEPATGSTRGRRP